MPETPAEPARFALSAALTVRRVGDKVFILVDPAEIGGPTPMHILDNATAVALWDALSAAGPAGAPLEDLAAGLQRRFAVDDARARADSRAFLAQLEALGVAHRVGR